MSSSFPPSNPPSPTVSNQQSQTQFIPPTKQATLLDAARTIRPQDFTTFYQKPCARESLLTGIGAGFAIGGLRFITLLSSRTASSTASTAIRKSPGLGSAISSRSTISTSATPSVSPSARASTVTLGRNSLSARIWRSMTWAVLSFTLVSAGAHMFCLRRRKLEHAAMARAAEIVGRKRDEKRAEAMKRRDERRKVHEEQKAERSRWGRWFGGRNDGDGKG